jgi:hypothetical protein
MANKTNSVKETEPVVTETPPPPLVTQQSEPEVSVQLKVSQWNTIIGCLDELPHKTSRILIDSIRGQAMVQLQAMQQQSAPPTQQ